MTKTTCSVCGKEFEAQRITALFCSDACRMRLKRNPELVNTPIAESDADAVVEVPVNVHVCTEEGEHPCQWYEEVDGVRRFRVSREHFLSLLGPAMEELDKYAFQNTLQKDCAPGVLQPDGSRKIVQITKESKE